MKKTINNKDISSIIFISILALFSIIVLFKLVLNNNDINDVDHRMSYHFRLPDSEEFISRKYQDNMDEIIADQMPVYKFFKTAYTRFTNYFNYKHAMLFNLDDGSNYVTLEKINIFNGYMLYEPSKGDYISEDIKEDVKKIKELFDNTNTNNYLYFIGTDSDYDFVANIWGRVPSYIFDNSSIEADHFGNFDFYSFDEYKDYFYKSDHHWNNVGAYRGYQDIAKLMNYKNVVNITNEICYKDKPSSGYKNIYIGGLGFIKDIMCKYEYDLPEFEIVADGVKLERLGSTNEELNRLDYIRYDDLYGENYGELIIRNKGKNNGKKLLVYSTSFSNAINELLAAEYQEAYILDGRYYKDKHLIDYINEHSIDDVLILCCDMMFIEDLYW